jgi:RNA polymerase sigma factor (sigma-70 family)
MESKAEQVVRELMVEHGRLGAYVLSITGDFHLTEDVLQNVAVMAIEKVRDVTDGVSLRVWLRRIARLKALEARQKYRREALLSDDVLDKMESYWESHAGGRAPAGSMTLEMLQACMKELTPSHRRLLVLRYVKALRSGEIAARLGVKVKTVYQALTRAHHRLADCIEKKRTSGTKQVFPDE